MEHLTCLQCGGENIETDDKEAMSFCYDCGYVTSIAELRSTLPVSEAEIGVFVSEHDDGTLAAEASLLRTGNTSRSAHMDVTRRVSVANLDAIAGQMSVPQSVRLDAQALLEEVVINYRGSHRALAAAVVFVSARQAQLPMHLPAVSEAAQMPCRQIWRLVQLTLQQLQLALPRVPPARFLEQAVNSICAKEQQDAVSQLAEALLTWSLQQEQLHMAPIHCCAAVLAIALQNLQLPTDKVGAAFGRRSQSLTQHILKIKRALIAASAPLPFAAAVTPATVSSYLPTILKFSSMDAAWKQADKNGNGRSNAESCGRHPHTSQQAIIREAHAEQPIVENTRWARAPRPSSLTSRVLRRSRRCNPTRKASPNGQMETWSP